MLVAISGRDRRRQSNLGAAEHVLACSTCAELAPTLVERRLPLAILVPAGALGPVLHAVAQKSRSHPARTTAAVGAAAAVAVALALMAREPQRPPVAGPPAPTCPGLVASGGQPVGPDYLAGMSGTSLEGRAVSVQSVPANEGFWMACGRTRVWVRLVNHPAPSRRGPH